MPVSCGSAKSLDAAAADAWEVVRTLRGSFLNSRGITSLQRPDGGAWPVVFVDGMYLGTLDELRGIPASTIDEVRFLNAGDAMLRYGACSTNVWRVTTCGASFSGTTHRWRCRLRTT